VKAKLSHVFIFASVLAAMGIVAACQSVKGTRNPTAQGIRDFNWEFLNQTDRIVPQNMTAFYSPEKPKLCAALRGNGDKVLAHFSSLAGVVERFGVVDGVSGGSSSAVSLFFYESALINPLIWTCGAAPCDEQTVRRRLAFSLKSTEAVLKVFYENPLVKNAMDMGKPDPGGEMQQGEDFLKYGFHMPVRGIFKRLKRRIIHRVAWNMMSDKFYNFTHLAVAQLVNRNLLGEVEDYLIDLPAQKRWELMRTLKALDFNNSDVSTLFREGLIDFPNLVKRIGFVADFFSGRGRYPKAQMAKIFNSNCVTDSYGKSWPEFLETPLGKNCERTIMSYMKPYFDYYRNSGIPAHSRINDPIGGALKALVPVSVIAHGGIAKVQKAAAEYQMLYESNRRDPARGQFEAAYKQWTDRTAQIKFDLDFDNELLYGYWGRYSDLKKVLTNWPATDEVKSQKYTPLGTVAWREVLMASPAEPGLSKITPLKTTPDLKSAGIAGYMAGGWVDLHPTQVAKAMGCERTIYITREWPEDNEYAEGLAKIFKISDERRKTIFDINDPNSSFNRSLREADAIWCSEWGKFKMFELAPMATQTFHSPVYLRAGDDPLFSRAAPLLQTYKPGCMPIERRG